MTIDEMNRRKRVMVYFFEQDDWLVLYGEKAKVPVSIWAGKCLADFGKIFQEVAFLYER